MHDDRPVCLVIRNAGPYHRARINAACHTVSGLVVIELAASELSYPWDRRQPNAETRTLFRQPVEEIPEDAQEEAVTKELNRIRPRIVVVSGYFERAMRAAAQWAKRNGASCVVMMESWKGDKRRFWLKERLKARYLRTLYDGAFVGGTRHYDYMVSLGFRPDQIWRGVDVVDNDHFEHGAESARQDALVWRSRFGVAEKYFICAARHAPEKNILLLLRTFARYRRMGGSWQLVLVGDGPDREQVSRAAADCQPGKVHLCGWRTYDEMPAFLGLASCLILPSVSEPWGLVVNEALAAGIPVLVSRRCGCQPELCHRGINGFDFDPTDGDSLVRLMLNVSEGSCDLDSFARAGRRIISAFTPATWGAALADCVRQLTNQAG